MLRMSPAPSTDRTFSPTLAGPRTRYRKIRKWCNRKKGKKQNPRGYSVLIIGSARGFLLCRNIACDISGISTEAPCEAARMCERHLRIEISDFVMRTFGLYPKKVLHQLVTPPKSLDTLKMVNRQRICFFVYEKSSHTLV